MFYIVVLQIFYYLSHTTKLHWEFMVELKIYE